MILLKANVTARNQNEVPQRKHEATIPITPATDKREYFGVFLFFEKSWKK
jgi:hypothetical protein